VVKVGAQESAIITALIYLSASPLYQAGPLAFPSPGERVLHAGIVCLLPTGELPAPIGRTHYGRCFCSPSQHTESVAWIAAVTDLQLTHSSCWPSATWECPEGARRPGNAGGDDFE
jgi:hypothetical protein